MDRTLTGSPEALQYIDCLLRILESVVHLKYLDLGEPRWFDMSDRRPYGQSRFRARRLIHDNTPQILKSIRSQKLRSLEGLMMPLVGADRTEGIYPEHLVEIIHSLFHPGTLENLGVDSLRTDVPINRSSPRLATVRSLKIAALFRRPRLDVLMHTFPSLDRYFDIRVPGTYYLDPGPREPLWSQTRAQNIAALGRPGA